MAGAAVALAMVVWRFVWRFIPRSDNETVSFVFYHFLYIPLFVFGLAAAAGAGRPVFAGTAGPGQFAVFILGLAALSAVALGRIFIRPDVG